MQANKVAARFEPDVPVVEIYTYSANKTKSRIVLFSYMTFDEAKDLLDSPKREFVLAKERHVHHAHVEEYGEIALVAYPLTTEEVRFEPLFFKVVRAGKLDHFVVEPQQLEPYERTPGEHTVSVDLECVWNNSMMHMPMGQTLHVANNIDWKQSEILMLTRDNGHIEFKRGKVFILTDGRAAPRVDDWPCFFRVEEGGFPDTSLFTAIPMRLVADGKPQMVLTPSK